MKRDYLGDSYDAVKRLWQQVLVDWAPLYAETRFVPENIREEFTRLTGIQMLSKTVSDPHSILNDPDTGVRLPNGGNQGEGMTHVSLQTILEQLRFSLVRTVITFDQSDYRNSERNRAEQRHDKMNYLIQQGVFAFYYVSHAPFLFAFSNADTLQQLKIRLISFGIPESRFQTME